LLVGIVVLLVLIAVSGVLSSAEIALSSSNRNKVKMLSEAGNQKAARLLAAIDEPSSFFATTQLYITFIAFFSGAYAVNVFAEPLGNWLHRVGLPLSEGVFEMVVFVVVTALLTYVALIIGELVPKRIAMQYAIPFSLRALSLLKVLSILALPFVKLLSLSANFVLKLIGIKDKNPDDITKEEICLMVESGGEHGHIRESEQDMIVNVFEFDKRTAADICTHRLDVVALSKDADFQTVVDVLTEHNYTRVPVYEESIDHICGILHSKDVLYYMVKHPDTSGFDLQTLIREPYFVPFSKKTDELFQEMREERVYIAVVIDEYGGTMGIVTMADLVEKIMGSIQDEYDVDEKPEIVSIGEGVFEVMGSADLELVQEHFEVELPIEEYDTLSGFLVGRLGYIPAEDERPEVVFEGLRFQIEAVQEKRIAVVRVTQRAEEDAVNIDTKAGGTQV